MSAVPHLRFFNECAMCAGDNTSFGRYNKNLLMRVQKAETLGRILNVGVGFDTVQIEITEDQTSPDQLRKAS